MLHPALVRLLNEDRSETVEAIAAPLRSVSPHIAQMVHAQVLSDAATLCDALWALMQEPTNADQGRALFVEYLHRRRKVGFSEVELLDLLAASQRTLLGLLEGMLTGDSLSTAREQLGRGMRALESMIPMTAEAAGPMSQPSEEINEEVLRP